MIISHMRDGSFTNEENLRIERKKMEVGNHNCKIIFLSYASGHKDREIMNISTLIPSKAILWLLNKFRCKHLWQTEQQMRVS